MTYSWIDNPTKTNVATYDPDILNECLMHLKYDLTEKNLESYCVNSAKINSLGYADFISKIDDSQVSIDCTNKNISMTYPNGKKETIDTDMTISNISADGTYIIIKEYSNTPIVTTNSVKESYISPTNPTEGDYWLDISSKPYSPYKYTSGSWVETPFIKLGEVTKASGTLGTPISYALNATSVVTLNNIGCGEIYTITHNLGYSHENSTIIGYFENISGSNYSYMPNGSSAYIIGDHERSWTSGQSYGSGIRFANNKISYLYTAPNGIYATALQTTTGIRTFTGATARIIIRRNF